MAAPLAEVVFDEAAIKAKVNPGIHAADQAYEPALKEGIPFREAYRRVAGTLKNRRIPNFSARKICGAWKGARDSRYPLQADFGAFS